MASLKELYTYYCRRWDCRPNSSFCTYLDEEYERNECQRILRVVDVSDNYLGKNGIIPVLDLVKNTKTVGRLDVSNNRLEHEQLEHLVYCLLLHPTIRSVVLRSNCLHDGSIDHVLKLLESNTRITEMDLAGNDFLPASLALVEDRLARNRETAEKLRVEDEALAAYRAEMADKRASFTARVSGSLTREASGGYLHFATWWKNPQYRLCVSRRARVTLALKTTQPEATQGTRQVGFAVLRFDGTRRVIDLGPRTVVAESPIDAQGHCCLDVELNTVDQYVVVPYTFQPGRPIDFALTATMLPVQSLTLQEEGWVTLDLLDERYDWFMQTVEAAWTSGAEGGGCAALPTWRHNPMHRLRYCGKQQPYFWAAPANVQLLLYKAVDVDENDEREIGLDVVEHDSYSHGRPPLLCTSELLRCSHPHQRRAAITAKFTVPSSSLDLFVVPSTKAAHQAGGYTLVIFSSVPFEAATSHFPHGWHHRVVDGEWNEEHCGGCKDLYASWKNNLAYKLLMQDPSGEDGSGTAAAEQPVAATASAVHHPLVACLEAAPVAAPVALKTATVDEVGKEKKKEEAEEEEEEEVDPAELRVRMEVTEFHSRHAEAAVEMCLAAVNDAPPTYPVRRSSVFSTVEAQLLLPDTRGEYLLVPMARHAGQTARYRLHLFSPTPFIVAGSDTLVERERQWQMALYASENEARRLQQAAAERDSEGERNVTAEAARLPELREAVERRAEIVSRCAETGLKFSDRDFPRGTSSLWLDPEAKTPFDFPKEYTWQRVVDVCAEAVCLGGPDGEEGRAVLEVPPFPYGKRQWLASIVNALAAKPHWLARVFGGYDREHGFAQFRFFKGSRWVGVTIDDFLPVDTAGQLCMGHSTSPRDFFFPLVEKAFAKLHRCYEALEPKVTPELSLLAILSQALEDVSGGLCTAYHLRPGGTATLELEDEEKNVLWRKLKEASKTNVLQCLILRADCPGAGEKQHVGLLPDHLYAVVDARFVDQQRLVRLRNWRDGADTMWRGKWVAESPSWNATLRAALEYDETQPATAQSPQAEFWLSYDEVLYYFSELLVTEEPASRSVVEGNFGNTAKTYAADTDVRLRAPQFALHIDEVVDGGCGGGVTPVEVTVGLHRADARMSVTRDKHAVASYRHALGMAVLATHDNCRHVKQVEESQVWRLQTPLRVRDIYFKVLLDPRHLAMQQLTLMPFREHEKDGDTPFLVSVSSTQATVRVVKVDDNTAVRVDGAWDGVSAGGPPTAPTWRNNQQFFLYPSESMEVTIALARTATMTGVASADAEEALDSSSVGFTVHTTRYCRSFLHFEATSVVLHAAGSRAPSHSAQATVTLAGMPERRGMPYVIVPYCSQSAAAGSYTLTVIGNKPMRLAPVEPRLDWHRVTDGVSMRAGDGSAGGSPRYPSWRCSPQLLMEFPVARAGRVLVAATNRDASDRRNALGLMLLRGSSDVHFGGRRRRLLYDADDVVATSEESCGRVELEVDVGAVNCPRGEDATAPLVLAVYTAQPYKEMDVDLTFYAETELVVAPVREWKYTALEEGSWELGMTAGGNRREYASWINNPFIGLATVRPTSVVLLLVQYPRNTEQLIVKRLGNKKAFLPPPITNPDRRMSVELDLVLHDAELTAVEGTGASRRAEVALTALLEASGDNKPYIVVPVTTVIDQDADYKLFVYADQPIDLFRLEKERLHYV